MDESGVSTWAVVLAAGEGSRLRDITTTSEGLVIPKQFCAFGSRRTLLAGTLDRALGLVPAERVVTVVAEEHRPFWQAELGLLAPWNVVVQPSNRGTAAGLLLPIEHVRRQDPDACVVVLPSDHHVEDEPVLGATLRAAVRWVEREPEAIVLLGMVPDEPEPQYGWIVPAPGRGAMARPVVAFVEKPDRTRATQLMRRGGLWASFMMAGRARAFAALFESALPDLVNRFRACGEDLLARGGSPTPALRTLYGEIDAADFSRGVLEQERERLRVIPVPACGWTDLGSPERVARWLNRRGLSLPAARAWTLSAGASPVRVTGAGGAA